MERSGGMASEPNLLQAVRRAASEISQPSVAPSSKSRRHRSSESNLHSHASRKSSRVSGSHRSHASSTSQKGFTLEDQQNHVLNSAMDRFVTDLQKEAEVANKDNRFYEDKIKGDLQAQKNEAANRREQAMRNQHNLRQQMEDNKMRRAEDRREFVEAASAHSFPLFTETFISLDEVTAYREKQKQIFRQELKDQNECIDTMKNLQKKEELDFTYDRDKNNILQMTRDRKAARDAKVKLGKTMVASWDRDLRLQNIKKAILSGKDMSSTLGPGESKPARSPGGSMAASQR
jgi:hypothetical protein